MSSIEMNETRARLHDAIGKQNFHLELFGDDLAAREGYKAHTGLEAVRFYLMQKHRWLPRDVQTMSLDDLRFALAEEMEGWVISRPVRMALEAADRDGR